jgi:hypothetical protein
MHLDRLVEKLPILADGITEFNGLSLPPLRRSILEFEGCHGAEIVKHLRREANEFRDAA